MKHMDDAQLAALYYGEERSGEREHLASCESCRDAYAETEAVLGEVSLPVPERGEQYGAEVWRRLQQRLAPAPARQWPWRAWVAAAAMATLIIAAFLAGRFWRPPQIAAGPIPAQVRERILLVAVGDHLERSQMVLLELMNAKPEAGQVDIAEEQELAGGLITSNRLYRQTAARAGDPGVAALLDELERVLLEVAHSPARLPAQEFEALRRRVEAQGIVFKVRVIGSRLQQEERKRS